MKLDSIEKRFADELRGSGDGSLRVLADLDEMFSKRIADLANSYKAEQDEGKVAPTPSEFVLAVVVYGLAIAEDIHDQLKPDKEGNLADVMFRSLVHSIMAIGARKTLMAMMQMLSSEPGKFQALLDELAKSEETRQ